MHVTDPLGIMRELPALPPITAVPVRLSEEVWPAEVWAEIQAIYDTSDPFAEEL